MEVAAISALVGALVSFIAESIPEVKAWLGKQTPLVVRLVFALLFIGLPALVAFGTCYGVALPGVTATCPTNDAAVRQIVINGAVAFLSSQLWHGYGNAALVKKG